MLTGKQKSYLRSEAHHLKPLLQVGKLGVNENLIEQIEDVLEKRELIKVSVLQNCEMDKKDVAEAISEKADAHIVQVIGSTIVLYKESIEHKNIQLPK